MMYNFSIECRCLGELLETMDNAADTVRYFNKYLHTKYISYRNYFGLGYMSLDLARHIKRNDLFNLIFSLQQTCKSYVVDFEKFGLIDIELKSSVLYAVELNDYFKVWMDKCLERDKRQYQHVDIIAH